MTLVRVPGIYAADRLPLERLRRGTPALAAQEDTFVNHVHADDLARIVVAALRHGQAIAAITRSDDAPQRMGDYFVSLRTRSICRGRAAHRARRGRTHAARELYSFMNESRRLVNARMKRELRVKLRYPSVHDGLAAARAER